MSKRNPYDCWRAKPWWCQPWSILLTGIGILSLSWALFQTLWLTILVAVPILVWWIYFLVLWPLLLQAAQEQNLSSDLGSEGN